MINYSDWNLTDDHSYNVYCALEYCRKHNEDGIYFPKAHYDFYGDTAAEKLLFVANHGISNLCRIGVFFNYVSQVYEFYGNRIYNEFKAQACRNNAVDGDIFGIRGVLCLWV